jgi:hypothetical protein
MSSNGSHYFLISLSLSKWRTNGGIINGGNPIGGKSQMTKWRLALLSGTKITLIALCCYLHISIYISP